MKSHDIVTQENEILATQLCQMVGQLIDDDLWRMWMGLVMPCFKVPSGICLKELRNITKISTTDSHFPGCYLKRALLTHKP